VLLLQAPLYAADGDNLSLFVEAVAGNDIDGMRKLSGSIDVNVYLSKDYKKLLGKHYPAIKRNSPFTALSIAIFNNNENGVSELLQLGADII
jgi:hypothetical protein